MTPTIQTYEDFSDIQFKKQDVIFVQTNCFNQLHSKLKQTFPILDKQDRGTKKGSDLKQGTFIVSKENNQVVVCLYTSLYIEDKPSPAYFKIGLQNSIPYLRINKLLTTRVIFCIPSSVSNEAYNSMVSEITNFSQNQFKDYTVIIYTKKKND